MLSRFGEIGEGVTCKVYKAFDKSGNIVAVKAYRKDYITHFYQETEILKILNHPNIVKLLDITNEFEIVLGWIYSNLHTFIKQCNTFQTKICLRQLLLGVEYIHSNDIVHCDLTPKNILYDGIRLKICDFGLSQVVGDGLTDTNIITANYRPPELLLEIATLYKYEVDMWSVGCIFAEMYPQSKQLFPNFFELMQDIIKITGKIPNPNLLPNLGVGSYDLMIKLLERDPKVRISASNALLHDYLNI